jgi:RNA polymerase sigma-70 factor (ECF subfamily)
MRDTAVTESAFLQLLDELRPRLHRYCARMMGSAIDGEDVLQEALANAAEAFAAASPLSRPEGWLFRIAHNAALDALRRRQREGARADAKLDDLVDTSAATDARVAARASLAIFMQLPATQRSTVLMIDLLGYSLAETVEMLGVSLATVKAALHRGRRALRRSTANAFGETARALSSAELARLRAYADRFNDRDFEALRDLLAEDVQLELVNRRRLRGKKEVSVYFTRYAAATGWSISPVLADGRLALLVNDATAVDESAYVVLLDWADARIAGIRDFRFARYVMDGMKVTPL